METQGQRWFGFLVLKGDGAPMMNKFIKGNITDCVNSLISQHLASIANESLLLSKVKGSKTFVQPSMIQSSMLLVDVDVDMPINVLYEMGIRYLVAEVKERVAPPEKEDAPRSAFDVLMSVNREYTCLPTKRRVNNARDKLYNDIVDLMETLQVGFTRHQEEIGKRIVGDLCDVLWYIDPFHDRFNERSCTIPKQLQKFAGYRDWRKQHKQAPKISSDELKMSIDQMTALLMMPWFLNEKFKCFKNILTQLCDSLRKYHSFLEQQKARSNAVHNSEEPVRSFTDNWSFKIIESKGSTYDHGKYGRLANALQTKDPYSPVDLLEFEPEDRFVRRSWLADMNLPFSYGIFTYDQGNYLGNLNILWKQPDKPDRDSSEDIQLINSIKSHITVYATRAMRKQFTEKYGQTVKGSPAVQRSLYRYLTGNSFAPSNAKEQASDERITNFLLHSDDPKLILDLRENNGKVEDPKFKPFWEEADKFLEEKSVVHERRSTEIAYMPFATSIRDFREQVLARMPIGSEAPSESWIRLNFYPSNPYKKSSLQYTGRFQVKHVVQQRLLRVQHEDASFAFHQYSLLKAFAVKWREHSVFQCLDDKAIVPVGEPGKPIIAVSRSHNAGLVSGSAGLYSVDHDYHVCGLVPSVCLSVEVPENVHDSFYHGDLHVTLKDKIFQPSHPIRHAVETVKIVRQHCSDDDVNSRLPILIRYTDGGPDHRPTFTSVQFASILEFMSLDLDMFVACRTAPHQSYNNPAERCMSLLNLGLQNVSLCRASMDTAYEKQMKSMTSMSMIRKSKKEELKDALKSSVSVTIETVKNIFRRLKKSNGDVIVHDACTQEEITEFLELGKLLSAEDGMEIKDFSKYPMLNQFVKKHCRKRHYSFQIKKCSLDEVADCGYCSVSPPRLPADEYSLLHFVPDPVLDGNGDYKPFENVYGTLTDDRDRPSMKCQPEAVERDKQFRSILVAGKVRGFVMCAECGKRRVVYCASKLSRSDQQALTRVQEELIYICGSCLFPGGDYQDRIIVKESLTCEMPIEASYYAGAVQVFDEICYYCGDLDILINSEVQQLSEDFGIVRPICPSCWENGKKPATRNATKIKKRRV